MDIYGYKAQWTEEKGQVASSRLDVYHRIWFLSEGHHPSLVGPRSVIFEPQIQQQIKAAGIKTNNAFMPSPVGDIWGHNLAIDATQAALVQVDTEIPIAPLYGRDLAGRIIHLSTGPHHKHLEEWAGDRNVTFPRFCHDLTADTQGLDLLEQVFFTKFRTLDMSLAPVGVPTTNPEGMAAGFYRHQNLYPYKTRLDTFYIDGWKLPQLEAVFARSEGISIQQAEATAGELFSKWQQRTPGQTYEDFYEAVGGASYMQSLFEKGCTLIPTFEACNGYHKLSRDFILEDFWPGRAVNGLHEITKRVASNAPEGTILQVLEPGVVMAHRIQPAKVVVSDGTGYLSPHHIDPDPLLPDVRLPHPRSVAKWGACWLPTHPKHFERPAIWGWDSKTGIFMQLKGPLWDPLHYYYASVDEVLKAYRGPALTGNRWLIPVPAQMKLKFYPIVPMRGYDTINQTFRDEMEEKLIRPFTSCMRFDDGKYACQIGYHPLPVPYEYELDNWWFPELDPRQRATPDAPLDVQDRLCPVIECPVLPEAYVGTLDVGPDAPWIKDQTLMRASTGKPLEDYPGLKRYQPQLSEKAMREEGMVYLENVPEDMLARPAREVAAENRPPKVIEERFPALAQAFFELAEEAAKRMQFRHQVFRRDPAAYQRDWWLGITPIMRPMAPAPVGPAIAKTRPIPTNPQPTTTEQVRPRGVSAASLRGPVEIE